MKTPNKADVIRCICEKNKESAAKDRRDWVQCQDCRNWSHPSCYRSMLFLCYVFTDFHARRFLQPSSRTTAEHQAKGRAI